MNFFQLEAEEISLSTVSLGVGDYSKTERELEGYASNPSTKRSSRVLAGLNKYFVEKLRSKQVNRPC